MTMEKPRQDLAATADSTFDPNADRLREECGVFGIFNHPDAAAITALGLHALQHRGQEAAGIVYLRRQALSFRTPHGPRRRRLHPPRGDRPPARQFGGRSCPLLHHRRDHPAQRAAAVRRAERRRLRHRPQRQPDQRRQAAPRSGARRRHDAVDHRHRGDPASGGPRRHATASSTASSTACASSRAPMPSSASPTRSWSAPAIRSASGRW